jgi:hypothetical protein
LGRGLSTPGPNLRGEIFAHIISNKILKTLFLVSSDKSAKMTQLREDKVKSEWAAVGKIYPKDEFAIAKTDRPDFAITRIEDGANFGAEVTGFYFHSASAKLKRWALYSDKVMHGGMVVEDRPHLWIDSVVVMGRKDENGNDIVLHGVFYQHPSFDEFLRLLSQAIVKKNALYQSGRSFPFPIELIITDEENYFSGWSLEQVSALLFKDAYFNELLQISVFNEIYFITIIGTEHKIIPLKKALFFSRFRLVLSYMHKEFIPHCDPAKLPFVFLSIMLELGFTNIKFGVSPQHLTIFICQNCVLEFTSEGVQEKIIKIPLLDRLKPVPRDAKIFDPDLTRQIMEDFGQYAKGLMTYLDEVIENIPVNTEYSC